MKAQKTLLVKTDGGARGNPGPAAIGVYIVDQQSKEYIHSFGKSIGKATNNVAEYQAVLEAFLWLKKNKNILLKKFTKVVLISDSSLLVNQLNGVFKIKKAHLQKLVLKIKNLEQELGILIEYKHVKRELNSEPDNILNNVLDKNNTGFFT